MSSLGYEIYFEETNRQINISTYINTCFRAEVIRKKSVFRRKNIAIWRVLSNWHDNLVPY
jgi:hypothetical protein